MVGSNSSVTAPRAFSRSPFRVMSKTSISVGSDSLRMSHHSTCMGQEVGGGCRSCSQLSRRCRGAECPGARQLPCASLYCQPGGLVPILPWLARGSAGRGSSFGVSAPASVAPV